MVTNIAASQQKNIHTKPKIIHRWQSLGHDKKEGPPKFAFLYFRTLGVYGTLCRVTPHGVPSQKNIIENGYMT